MPPRLPRTWFSTSHKPLAFTITDRQIVAQILRTLKVQLRKSLQCAKTNSYRVKRIVSTSMTRVAPIFYSDSGQCKATSKTAVAHQNYRCWTHPESWLGPIKNHPDPIKITHNSRELTYKLKLMTHKMTIRGLSVSIAMVRRRTMMSLRRSK